MDKRSGYNINCDIKLCLQKKIKKNINPVQNKFSDNNASLFYDAAKHLVMQQSDH
jgi:hypothetical protein